MPGTKETNTLGPLPKPKIGGQYNGTDSGMEAKLPPVEVKPNPGKSTERLNISDYEVGTSRS